MKNIKTIFLIIIAFSFSSIANAQYCNTFAMSKDMVLTYQNRNPKAELLSESKTTCYDIYKDSLGTVFYKVKIEVFNPEGVIISSNKHDMKCKNGKLYVDFESYTDVDEEKEFSGIAISLETDDLEYPEELVVDQKLPDAMITISSVSDGKKKKSYVAKTNNRKVVGIETITVPSGSYECYKITYDLNFKILTNKKYKVIEYISEGIGQIKTETYNKKGKLKSYSVLAELKK